MIDHPHVPILTIFHRFKGKAKANPNAPDGRVCAPGVGYEDDVHAAATNVGEEVGDAQDAWKLNLSDKEENQSGEEDVVSATSDPGNSMEDI